MKILFLCGDKWHPAEVLIFLLTSVLFCCISFVCYTSEDNNDTRSIVIPRMIDCHAEISTEDFELITEYVLDTYTYFSKNRRMRSL